MRVRLSANRAKAAKSKLRQRKYRPGAPINNSAPTTPQTIHDVTAGLGLDKLTPEELDQIAKSLENQLHQTDPGLWINDRCGEFIWSKQREIAQSVCDNRRTAVHSCHEIGKSFIASRIAAWWLCTHKPGDAFVVSSAPTGRQVRVILWREIGRIQAKANLPGRCNQTEWHLTMPAGNEEIVGFGMKPADMDPTAFQGIHARYVLVVFDEACGIPTPLWDAADSLIANDDSRFLAIGNPDDPDTEFFTVCQPGSGWNAIGVSAFDSPNFTGEYVPEDLKPLLVGPVWVAEKKKKWGEDNPLYISKVLGRFPTTTTDGLIPMRWIRLAQEREMKPLPTDPNELGVDIGGGGDPNIIAHRRGPIVRVIRRDVEPDTMKTCGQIIVALNQTGATCAKVDVIGIGRGVVDRGKEQGKPFVGINVANKPTAQQKLATQKKNPYKPKPEQEFANLKAEGFWHLRTLFQDNNIDIDPMDEDLAAQLAALKWEPNSSGAIQIVSKKELRMDISRSPDEAEAVMLAMLPTNIKGRKWKATWGRRESNAA
jgi:hypothetical protein